MKTVFCVYCYRVESRTFYRVLNDSSCWCCNILLLFYPRQRSKQIMCQANEIFQMVILFQLVDYAMKVVHEK